VKIFVEGMMGAAGALAAATAVFAGERLAAVGFFAGGFAAGPSDFFIGRNQSI
jgi:hypothetical protein